MNLILETTTGRLVPAGSAPRLPRSPVAATLQLVTNSVAALQGVGVPVTLRIYQASDLNNPIATFAAWTRNAEFLLYQATINPLEEAGLGWLQSGTLVGRISYGAPNVNGAYFQVQYGEGATQGAPTNVQVVINNYTGAVGSGVQLIGTFGGKVALNQTEGFWRVKADNTLVGLQLNAQDAPTGTALIVEAVVNGMDTGKTATLAAGAKYQETIFGSPLELLAGDVVRFKATQVGSTKAGTNLNVSGVFE